MEELESRRVLAATVPLFESFEVAELAALTNWTFATTGSGTVSLDNVSAAHDGTTTLRFDVASDFVASTSEAVVQLDLSSVADATDLAFDFWMKRPNSSTSSEFFLQVDVSGDGATWVNLSPKLQPVGNVWVNYVYDLDDRLANAEIQMDSDVFLRLRQSASHSIQDALIDKVQVRRADVMGPQGIALSPDSTVAAPIHSFGVTFSEPIDPATFTAVDVMLFGPDGAIVALSGDPVDSGDQTSFTVNLAAPQSLLGVYRAVIGPNVTDVHGNAMNQDQDESNGESGAGDQFISTFQLGFAAAQSVPYLQGFEVDRLDQMPGWSFATDGSGTIALGTAAVHSGAKRLGFDQTEFNVSSTKDATLLLDLSGHASSVDLALDFYSYRSTSNTSNPLVISASGDGVTWSQLGDPIFGPSDTYVNHFVDLDQSLDAAGIVRDSDVYLRFHHQGSQRGRLFYIDDLRIDNRDAVGPRVVSAAPIGTVSAPVNQIEVVFNKPIDASSLTAADAQLFDAAGFPITVGSIVSAGDGRTFHLEFDNQWLHGSYRMSIGPNVLDLAGNPMNQDGDQANGEPRVDAFHYVFEIGPPVAQTIPYSQDFEVDSLAQLAGWRFDTDGRGQVSLSESSEPHSGFQHLLLDQATSASSTRHATLVLDLQAQESATDLSLDFRVKRLFSNNSFNVLDVSLSGDGVNWSQLGDPIRSDINTYVQYTFDLDQALTAASIVPDQSVYLRFSHPGTSASFAFTLDDIRIDQGIDLAGPAITSMSPAGSVDTPLSQFEVVFDEPIDASTFTAADVTARGPLGPIELAGDPIDSGDQRTFSFALASDQPIAGTYRISIGPEILDLNGNPMNQDGDQINGEIADRYSSDITILASTVSLPYAQSFDSVEAVGNQWLFDPKTTGRIQLVRDGNRDVLRLDNPSNTVVNEAIVSLDLLGESGVKLLFEEQNIGDGVNATDGLYISANQGATWTKVLNGAPTSPDWQFRQLDLDSAAASAGLTYNNGFLVKIQTTSPSFSSWPTGGRQYDNFYVETAEPIVVSLDVATVSEGATTNPILKVSRGPGASLGSALELTLSSDDLTEASVQTVATIPANGMFVEIPILIQNDDEIDGPQLVGITVSTANGAPRTAKLTVTDDEPATLLASVDRTTVSEATGPNAVMMTLTRNRDVDTALDVTLSSSDIGALVVPAMATFPAGQTSITVGIATHNDFAVDGTQHATVTATAVGYVDASASINVEDDDTPSQRTIGGYFTGVLPLDTYTATFDVIVPTGEAWSIMPGSTIRFDPGAGLLVEGTVIADGDVGAPIRLTSSQVGSESPGDWIGVVIKGISQAVSRFDHVEIAYAERGVLMEDADPRLTISHSEIHHHRLDGISANLGPAESLGRTVTIETSEIHSNRGHGIAMTARGMSNSGSSSVSPTVRGNEIHHNGDAGIHFSTRYTPISNGTVRSGNANPLLIGNHIHHNPVGIEAFPISHSGTFGSTSVSAEIYNNVIESNAGDAIVLGGGTRALNSNKIFNNTIASNGGAGLRHSSTSSSGMQVRNNILVGNAFGMRADSPFVPSAQQVGFNDVFGNASSNWTNYPVGFGVASTTNLNGTPSDAEFNISVDPMFLAGTLYDVELESAINDAGTSGGQPYVDFLGRLRDAPYDLGAYEHDFVTNVVTTLIDEDDGGLGLGTGNSLREIINATNARAIPDTIAFDTSLFGGTIVLNGVALPTLTDATTIQGPGANLLTISGNGMSRILQVGGAVTAEISGLTIRDASDGGIYNDGTLTIRDSVVRNNQGVNGGGIRSAGTLIVERTTINNNAASSSGGGIYIGGGSVTIVDSTLDANTAAGSGGGILNDRTLAIFNSTLTGNFANLNGGAIAQLSSNDTATLKNVTVTLNRSDADGNASGIGGGIYGGQTKLENTIVAGNLRNNVPDELSTTLIHPSTHNLIGDAATAGGLSDGVDGNRVGVDPRLGPLANHGGPTRTHSLLLGSPAIDAGDGSLAVGPDSNPLLHDQRGPGYPRLVDGNGRGEVAVDIGAFESPLQLPLVQSIVINDGATQRSSLKTLRVTFNTQVDIDQVTSDPFQFVDADTGGVIVDLPVITVQNGRTVVDFTFAPGAHVDGGGSLIDGRYRLTVEGARVSAFGLNLDGDRDGLGGGNQVFGAQAADRFFRKFGDQNGNNSVDLLDFAEFRRSFGLTSGQERYIASLDSNYNNMIDLLDFAAFRRNFGT